MRFASDGTHAPDHAEDIVVTTRNQSFNQARKALDLS